MFSRQAPSEPLSMVVLSLPTSFLLLPVFLPPPVAVTFAFFQEAGVREWFMNYMFVYV